MKKGRTIKKEPKNEWNEGKEDGINNYTEKEQNEQLNQEGQTK